MNELQLSKDEFGVTSDNPYEPLEITLAPGGERSAR